MKITIDPQHEPQAITTHIPKSLRRSLIPGADAKIIPFKEGRIVTQKKIFSLSEGIGIWDHKVLNNREVVQPKKIPELHMSVTMRQPTMCLVFTLNGSATADIHPYKNLKFTSRYYRPMYLPDVLECAVVAYGDFHVLVLAFGDAVLQKLAVQNPEFEPFVQYFKNKEVHGMPGTQAVLTKKVKDLLYKIIRTKASTTIVRDYQGEELAGQVLEEYLRYLSKPHESIKNSAEKEKQFGIYAAFIKDNKEDYITISLLAEKFPHSAKNIQALFRKNADCTVGEFATLERINKAKTLLDKGGHSMEEVAALCNYNCYPTFFIAFKKQTKMTPTEYLEDLKLKGENRNE